MPEITKDCNMKRKHGTAKKKYAYDLYWYLAVIAVQSIVSAVIFFIYIYKKK